jgi:hypothetical protein
LVLAAVEAQKHAELQFFPHLSLYFMEIGENGKLENMENRRKWKIGENGKSEKSEKNGENGKIERRKKVDCLKNIAS